MNRGIIRKEMWDLSVKKNIADKLMRLIAAEGDLKIKKGYFGQLDVKELTLFKDGLKLGYSWYEEGTRCIEKSSFIEYHGRKVYRDDYYKKFYRPGEWVELLDKFDREFGKKFDLTPTPPA